MSTNNSERHRRRKYVIDPKFQWEYAITIALMVFVISSITGAVLYGALHEQAQLRSSEPLKYSAGMTFALFLAGIAFTILATAAVALWCMVITRRMCGPLAVLSGYLRELGEGRFPTPRPLKRKDHFKELYKTFTEAVNGLMSTKRAELGRLTEAAALVEKLRNGDEGQSEDLESLSLAIEALRLRAAKALDEPLEAVTRASTPEDSKFCLPVPSA